MWKQSCDLPVLFSFYLFQAKEYARKAVLTTEVNQDAEFSKTVIEFMKVLEKVN